MNMVSDIENLVFQSLWLLTDISAALLQCNTAIITCIHLAQFSFIWHIAHGPLARYVKLWAAHAPGMPETFSLSPWVSDPDMHHGTCMTYVPWCMPGSLTRGFLWSWWRGKCSWHSRYMRNLQFHVSGKRLMGERHFHLHIWQHAHHTRYNVAFFVLIHHNESIITYVHLLRCNMAFIEPMHRNKPNITYLRTSHPVVLHLAYSTAGVCDL